MKFAAHSKFYVLLVILRFSLVCIFILSLHNWSIDFVNNPPYLTKDLLYYYGNCQFLLGQSNTYYPQYSIGSSLIGIPIYFVVSEYNRFLWVSSFVMCFISSLAIFFVGRIAEQWYKKNVGILSSFLWFIFPFLAISIFQDEGIERFLFFSGFAGILSDTPSLFFNVLTVYYLTLILFNQEYVENKKKWYMACGLSQGLALTMRITNIALLLVVLFVLSSLRDLSNDKFGFWGKEHVRKEKLQIVSNVIRKIREIRKEELISVLLFVGCIFIGFLPELLLKTITVSSTSYELLYGQYLSGSGYYIAIKVRGPWGGVEYYSTSNLSRGFLIGLQFNYLLIVFLIAPYLAYLKSRHLSKLLPILIFFAFLFVYSFWSYFPLLIYRFLFPTFPFCFVSLSASLIKLFDLSISLRA